MSEYFANFFANIDQLFTILEGDFAYAYLLLRR